MLPPSSAARYLAVHQFLRGCLGEAFCSSSVLSPPCYAGVAGPSCAASGRRIFSAGETHCFRGFDHFREMPCEKVVEWLPPFKHRVRNGQPSPCKAMVWKNCQDLRYPLYRSAINELAQWKDGLSAGSRI